MQITILNAAVVFSNAILNIQNKRSGYAPEFRGKKFAKPFELAVTRTLHYLDHTRDHAILLLALFSLLFHVCAIACIACLCIDDSVTLSLPQPSYGL